MRNIRVFDTFAEFLASQAAVSGTGEYVEDITPGFAYIREVFEQTGKGVVYNKPATDGEDYVFGDIIYYDGSDRLKKCFYSAFTGDMGEKVGFIVVPTSLSPDGNARMVSFGSVQEESTINGDTTYDPVHPAWTNHIVNEEQTLFNSAPAFEYSDGNDEALLAAQPKRNAPVERYENVYACDLNEADYSSDISSWGMPNPYTEGEYYPSGTSNTMKAVSPFLDNNLDTQDVHYAQEELAGGSIGPEPVAASSLVGGSNYNMFSDFSGYTWTYGCPPEYDGGDVAMSIKPETTLKSIKPVPSGQVGAYFPHNYAREFYTDGTQAGDWYLPSAGEMGFLMARLGFAIGGVMTYLYQNGLLGELDNLIPGEAQFFTSTVVFPDQQASQDSGLKSSIPGGNIGPAGAYPVLAYYNFNDGDGDMVQFSYNNQRNDCQVLPFAMIKDGTIQHTQGNYTEENGHKAKDLEQGIA